MTPEQVADTLAVMRQTTDPTRPIYTAKERDDWGDRRYSDGFSTGRRQGYDDGFAVGFGDGEGVAFDNLNAERRLAEVRHRRLELLKRRGRELNDALYDIGVEVAADAKLFRKLDSARLAMWNAFTEGLDDDDA